MSPVIFVTYVSGLHHANAIYTEWCKRMVKVADGVWLIADVGQP
jgi:hypothetical protein